MEGGKGNTTKKKEREKNYIPSSYILSRKMKH